MPLRFADLWKGGPGPKGERSPVAPPRDAILRRSPHVWSARRAEETALLDLRGQRYYPLDQVGTFAWGMLAAGATARQISDAVRGEYGLPPDGPVRVEADVARLLGDMLRAGLVVAEHESGARPRRSLREPT